MWCMALLKHQDSSTVVRVQCVQSIWAKDPVAVRQAPVKAATNFAWLGVSQRHGVWEQGMQGDYR